ncbi:hypothetical protein N7520_005050 [Penicillium odoratum]|uniref:uncharacterized protein n=1 Tax=Penicillium odoratum TaxID=1167516 RepID=UPI002547BF8D|nr:uncharacterized protein N7520_005050 [Penicillium odoratum]KAJ5765491.1 hypothetical protein N7520_005050 [Penicillium odoratum]
MESFMRTGTMPQLESDETLRCIKCHNVFGWEEFISVVGYRLCKMCSVCRKIHREDLIWKRGRRDRAQRALLGVENLEQWKRENPEQWKLENPELWRLENPRLYEAEKREWKDKENRLRWERENRLRWEAENPGGRARRLQWKVENAGERQRENHQRRMKEIRELFERESHGRLKGEESKPKILLSFVPKNQRHSLVSERKYPSPLN